MQTTASRCVRSCCFGRDSRMCHPVALQPGMVPKSRDSLPQMDANTLPQHPRLYPTHCCTSPQQVLCHIGWYCRAAIACRCCAACSARACVHAADLYLDSSPVQLADGEVLAKHPRLAEQVLHLQEVCALKSKCCIMQVKWGRVAAAVAAAAAAQ